MNKLKNTFIKAASFGSVIMSVIMLILSLIGLISLFFKDLNFILLFLDDLNLFSTNGTNAVYEFIIKSTLSFSISSIIVAILTILFNVNLILKSKENKETKFNLIVVTVLNLISFNLVSLTLILVVMYIKRLIKKSYKLLGFNFWNF